MDYKQELYRFFSTLSGNERSCDVYYDLFSLICTFEPPLQHLALTHVFKAGLFGVSNGLGHRPNTSYTVDQIDLATDIVWAKFFPAFEAKMTKLAEEKTDPEKFYHTAWREIRVTPLLTSKLERVLAFYGFCNMDVMPYAGQTAEDFLSGDGTQLSLEECREMMHNCIFTCNGAERREDVYFDLYMMISSLPRDCQPTAYGYLASHFPVPDGRGPGREQNPMFTDVQLRQTVCEVIKSYFPLLAGDVKKWKNIHGQEETVNGPYGFIWDHVAFSKALKTDLERACALCVYTYCGTDPDPEDYFSTPTADPDFYE
ncbi:MAG: hypothetical protein IJY86_11285 [Clostridia bacterium]|nr:hypothetical protein [Clostridia bacterium]